MQISITELDHSPEEGLQASFRPQAPRSLPNHGTSSGSVSPSEFIVISNTTALRSSVAQNIPKEAIVSSRRRRLVLNSSAGVFSARSAYFPSVLLIRILPVSDLPLLHSSKHPPNTLSLSRSSLFRVSRTPVPYRFAIFSLLVLVFKLETDRIECRLNFRIYRFSDRGLFLRSRTAFRWR